MFANFVSCGRGKILLTGLLLAALSGCGGPQAPKREFADVAGKVSYKGKPLIKGQVMFQPGTGSAIAGEIKADGTYTLKGVIGSNTVMIVSRDEMGETSADKPESRQMPKTYIPDKYGGPSSGLIYEVKKGSNTADFDLK